MYIKYSFILKFPTTPGVVAVFSCGLTFTLESLAYQAKQHLPAEVTEVRRLVRVDIKHVWSYLQVLHRSLGCNAEQYTVQCWDYQE